MIRNVFLVVVAVAGLTAAPAPVQPAAAQTVATQTIAGSGSTFAFPIVARWAEAYRQATGIQVTYQPVGSTAGEADIRAGLVDFSITDAPLVDAQLLRDGLSQFPVVMGAIVPVVNLDGVKPGQLHLPGTLLAEIYLGRITHWRDPAIAAANPGLALPDRPIQVIYRTDGSGTTFNWTSYLAQANPYWRGKIGSSTKVAWPVGAGAKGTGGVATAVARTKGAIGYVEYSAALRNHLAYVLADNHSGHFVAPDQEGFKAATDSVDWTAIPDFAVVLTDTTDPNAYPLMATSFVLMRSYGQNENRDKVLAFFRWVLDRGQDMANALDYLPLPQTLVTLVESRWPNTAPTIVTATPR